MTTVMKLGAVGYLLKSTSSRNLKEAVLRATSGMSILSPEIAQNVISRLIGDRATRAPLNGRTEMLTRRESEVLEHIGGECETSRSPMRWVSR